MSVINDFEKSNIYKKIGEFLIANPDAIPEEDIVAPDRYTRDMVRIHTYYAKNAAKQQEEIDELKKLVSRIDQLENDIKYLDEIKANK